jgi:hypothetical protein
MCYYAAPHAFSRYRRNGFLYLFRWGGQSQPTEGGEAAAAARQSHGEEVRTAVETAGLQYPPRRFSCASSSA